jgi:ribosomal protein S6
MDIYELTYITSPELTREEIETVAKEIESFIQENEGTILRRENPIAKTLSYSIKNQRSGFFNVLNFQLKSEKLNELKEKVEKNIKIIRHILVIKNPERRSKIRREKRKFGFISKSEALKNESLSKEPFSFSSPFASNSAESQKSAEGNLDGGKATVSPDDKKPAEDKSEKIELKDIEEKLDEILGE